MFYKAEATITFSSYFSSRDVKPFRYWVRISKCQERLSQIAKGINSAILNVYFVGFLKSFFFCLSL